MLLEQTIEFELRSLGPLVVRVLQKLVIFMTKQKSPQDKSLQCSIIIFD